MDLDLSSPPLTLGSSSNFLFFLHRGVKFAPFNLQVGKLDFTFYYLFIFLFFYLKKINKKILFLEGFGSLERVVLAREKKNKSQ
jgi:hypothetical protein